jgi:replicative DNA helicase
MSNLHHMPPEADDVTRALPHALGPEKSLLSSMLQDPQDFIGLAIEMKLTEAHFYLPHHSTLFGFLVELFEAGHEVELVSLIQRLIDRGLLDRIGGPSTLTDLYTYAPSPGHFRHHLQHVKDKFVLRSIIQNSTTAISQAYDTPEEVAELLDSVEAGIMSIRDGSDSGKAITIKQSVENVIDELQGIMRGDRAQLGIPTGFERLDAMTSGLQPGQMFVIAARPSMGKTSLMMNIVENVAVTQGKPVMVFSCEMTAPQLTMRLVCARARFDLPALKAGQEANEGHLQRIQLAALEIGPTSLFIDDTEAITINELRAKARRRHRSDKLALIAIDYLQLMKSRTKQAQNSREREISEISAGIKGLAKELGIPIIVLAQLNRGPESRTGKNTGKSTGIPRMADLRESGSIEQDADLVGLLYRPGYYAEDEEQKDKAAGKAQLILAKNRNGPTGQIPLTFVSELMKFENGSPVSEPSPSQQARSRFDP